MLEALGQFGRRVGDPAVDRAVAYMRRSQEADGSWFGRWGVNYIYGTWQVLTGLAAVGVPADDPMMRCRRELAARLSAASRRLGRIGRQLRRAASARPRTGHRLANGLGPAGAVGGRPARRIRPSSAAFAICIERQQADGTWDEPEFTGTGFPRVFYLRYHLYPIYFPLHGAGCGPPRCWTVEIEQPAGKEVRLLLIAEDPRTDNTKEQVMGVPLSQMWTVATYVLGHKLRGIKRYPLVMMLEPLFRCNLACAGCGKIQYPADILRRHLSPEAMLPRGRRVRRPIVSIPGGEPLLHPQIDEIVAGLVARKKYIYLCTNALKLEECLDQFTAVEILFVLGPHGRPARRARPRRLPRGRVRHCRAGHSPRDGRRLPRDDQHHVVRHADPAPAPRLLRRDDGPGRRGDDALARL